jgi:hypothetical protein
MVQATTHITTNPPATTERVFFDPKEHLMAHTHQHLIYTPRDERMDFMGDDEPFVFETHTHTHVNPFESDDPEVAYHEYLAERFSR